MLAGIFSGGMTLPCVVAPPQTLAATAVLLSDKSGYSEGQKFFHGVASMKRTAYLISAMIATMAATMFGVWIFRTPELIARTAVPTEPVMTLTSPAFHNESVLPRRFTADGRDISPPLAWSHVPAKAVSLALVMIPAHRDAHGPLAFRHWMIINIPPTAKGLPENLPRTKRIASMPSVQQGKNSFGYFGYGGPSPRSAQAGTHHYRIILYALSRKLLFAPDCLPCLHHAMAGYVLAQATLHVRYGRSDGR